MGLVPGIHLSLGFHPRSVSRTPQRERAIFLQNLPRCDFVGEIGLDYSGGSPDRSDQRTLLNWILDQSGIDRKILSVHSRRAESDVISTLASSGVRAILHWYTGPKTLVDRALDSGLYFSVNASMLRTSKGRELVAIIPRHRILTETDGPYCRIGRVPETPSSIPDVIESLALAWDVPHHRARSTVWANWTALLSSTLGHSKPW